MFFTKPVPDPLETNLDGIANLELVLPPWAGKFPQRHATIGLEPDIDDGEVLLDAVDGSLDDGTFLQIAVVEGLFEHLGKIFARRRGGTGTGGGGHEIS